MPNTPERFENVAVVCKANVFHDGKVISHTVFLPDGKRKSLGVMFPCSVTFNTQVAERMEITAGTCRARLAGESQWKTYAAGAAFNVPARSSFEMAVDQGTVEYICSFE